LLATFGVKDCIKICRKTREATLQSSTLNPALHENATPKAEPKYWLFAVALLAFVPAIQSTITWSYTGHLSGQQALVRIFSLVTVCAEIILLVLAERSGFSYVKTLKSLPKTIQIVLGVWLSGAVLAYAIKPDYPLISGLVLLRYILQGVALAVLVHLVSSAQTYKDQKWFATLSLGGIAYFTLLAVFALTVPDPKTLPWEYSMPSATSIRHIGNYLAILSLAPAALLLTSKETRIWPYALCLGVLTMGIAWTGSRAAWLGLVVAVIAGCIFVRSTISSNRFKLVGLSVFLGTAVSAVLPNPTPMFGILRFWSSIQPGVEMSSGRIELWTNTFTEILKQPLIGHGAGRFAINMNEIYNYDVDNPHNFMFQYFYDWGLIGGGAGLALLAFLGRAIFQRRGKEPMVVFAAIAGFTLLIFVGLLEGMLYHPMKMMLVILLIAPIFRTSAKQADSE
jgi:O-antigen ligase